MSPAPLHHFAPLIKDILLHRLDVKKTSPGMLRAWLHIENVQWRNQDIDIEEQVFIPVRDIKRHTNSYRELMDYAATFKRYSNKQEGVCQLITSWKEEFVDDSLKYRRAMLVEVQKLRRAGKSNDARVLKFFPGANPDNYWTTPSSPHRLYHGAQNSPRTHKDFYYEGHIDIDQVNAHGNIAAREFERAGLLNDDMHHFLTSNEALESMSRVEYRGLTPKRLRLRAVNGCKDRKLRATGCEQYDALCAEIESNWKQMRVGNVHIHMTELEQRVINRMIAIAGESNVCLRMHDGAILEPHVDAHSIVLRSAEATGYDFKSRVLGGAP